jgi:hypothetical protein
MDFEKLLAGEVGSSIPEGDYDMKIVDARSHAGKGNGTVFVTAEVISGPLAGETTEFSIYIPDETAARGAKFFFAKKLAGFNLPGIGAAMNEGDPAAILAEAIVDQTVSATLSIQGDGAYAGSNQLDATKPLDGTPTAAPAAAPAKEETVKVEEAASEDVPF